MDGVFWEASDFNQNLDNWDTSKVSTFDSMFNTALKFNNGASSTSGGTMIWRTNPGVSSTMTDMFTGASVFNQDISGWNTANVTSMERMFSAAIRFNNGDLSTGAGTRPLTLDTRNVTNFFNMFQNARAFNQDVSGFDLTKATNVSGMFDSASGLGNFNNGLAAGQVANFNLSFNPSASST
jgi:surface protein